MYLIKRVFLSSYKNDKSDRHISDEEYLHLQDTWDTFNLINLKTFTIII